jgi:MFS family permease
VRKVLQLGAYRRLLVAYTLNELAWGVGTIAISYLVYRRTGSAVGAAAFYLCAQFVPALLSPAVVAKVDRRPARWLLPVLYGAEALIFLVLAGIARHFNLAAVLALALLDGVLALTARPIARATTVEVTSAAGLLREGNALTNTCFSIAFMVGPAIGGAVVAAGSASAALVANTVLFGAIALTLATAAQLPAPAAVDDETGGRLRRALAHVRAHRRLRLLLGLQATAVLFFTMSIPVEVVYAQHSLHAGAGGYGGLLSAWGGGAVLGSAVYARWHGAQPRVLMALGAGLIGAGLAGMAAAPTLALALVAAVVAGIGNGVEAVAARTAVQEETEANWMALVMSFSESLGEAMPGIGILLGGAITALATPRAALATGGVGALVVAASVWALVTPHRGYRRTASEPPL